MPRQRRHRERAARAQAKRWAAKSGNVPSRRAVRHMRLRPDGRPVLCVPTAEEVTAAAGRRVQSAGKPVYDTRKDAVAAAALLDYQRRLWAYECPRGDDGHWHLTTDPKGKQARQGNRPTRDQACGGPDAQ